jgi:hypothetical protein
LAWDPPTDDINVTKEFASVHVLNLSNEHRSRIQGRFFHPRHERSTSIGVPLDVAHHLRSSEAKSDGELETTDSRE